MFFNKLILALFLFVLAAGLSMTEKTYAQAKPPVNLNPEPSDAPCLFAVPIDPKTRPDVPAHPSLLGMEAGAYIYGDLSLGVGITEVGGYGTKKCYLPGWPGN